MYNRYSEIRDALKVSDRAKIAVAAAEDKQVLETIKQAYEMNLAEAILVGNALKIKSIKDEIGFSQDVEIIDVKDEKEAALIASKCVHDGKANILMKGLVNSSIFLKAVLNEKVGLRTGKLLSHLSVFEIPGYEKLAYYTDCGMNIFPDFEAKKQILSNSIEALHSLGNPCPNVAILTANEMINPKMPATLDAAKLVEFSHEGELPKAIIEGPIALDVALSKEAAHHKNLISAISGEVDLFLVPNIEAGNMVAKALIYCAGAKMAGLVLGATNPIVMTSRSETAEGKLNSVALACFMQKNKKEK